MPTRDHWPTRRYEIKYFLPPGTEDVVRSHIRPFVVHDPHASDGHGYRYVVRSLYFDTAALDAYYEKLDGIKIRKKIRVRTYEPYPKDETVFLEIKRRFNTWIYKERCPVPFAQLPEILSGDGAVAMPEGRALRLALRRFRYVVAVEELEPVLLISYTREAFIGRDDPRLRVTMDQDVKARWARDLEDLYRDGDFKRIRTERTILECKFDERMPPWLVRLVRRLGLRAQSISKYALSVEAHLGPPG
jgi:hypothetical protein